MRVYRKVTPKKLAQRKNSIRKLVRSRMIVRHAQKTKRKRMLRSRVKRIATVDYSLIFRRNQQELSVILTILPGEELNKELLHHVQGLQPKEVIVVQLGPLDRILLDGIEQDIRFISYPHAQNCFVGRGIGANYATGEILLFLDNHYSITTNDLLPFVSACYGKSDIVLSNSNPFYARKDKFDPVNVAKSFLNHTLQLPHLMFSSLTDTPHAIKKRTADIVGFENLIVPPKAMAMAVVNGLTIGQIRGINHLHKNKVTPMAINGKLAKETILGDHIEAFNYLQAAVGNRAYFTDKMRRRDRLADIRNKK